MSQLDMPTGINNRSPSTVSRSGLDAVGQQLERVYSARYASFRRAVAAIVHDDEQAHDIVQEGFARAFAERRRFGGGSLEAWVWQIVVHKAFDARRARRHRPLGEGGGGTVELFERDPELGTALRSLAPR